MKTSTSFSTIALFGAVLFSSTVKAGAPQSQGDLDMKRNKSVVEMTIFLENPSKVEEVVIERAIAGTNQFRPVKTIFSEDLSRVSGNLVSVVDNYPLPLSVVSAYRIRVTEKAGSQVIFPEEILVNGVKLNNERNAKTTDEGMFLGYEESLHVEK